MRSSEGSRPRQPFLSPKVSSRCYHTLPLCHPRVSRPARVTEEILQGYGATYLVGAPAGSPLRVAW